LAAALAEAVPELAAWHTSRSSSHAAVLPTLAAAAMDAPDAEVGMAAGCLVARTLAALSEQQQQYGIQAEGADAVRHLVSSGAELVLGAVEEGSMRAAMDERAAVERAQAQLASSSLNGISKAPVAGDTEDSWLEDVRGLWEQTLRSAASLARCNADFRAAAKARRSAWAVRQEGGRPGRESAELRELRAAVYGP
jgi:hypothetical protein